MIVLWIHESDVKAMIGKAEVAFHPFGHVKVESSWQNLSNKLCLFNTNVKSMLLNGAEPPRTNKTTPRWIRAAKNVENTPTKQPVDLQLLLQK